MKLMIFHFFSLAFFLIILDARNQEKLEIFPLGAKKNLLHFSFDFTETLQLETIIFHTNVWPRSVFDVLLKKANVKNLKIFLSNGRINPFYKETHAFPFETPESGTKIYLNSDADYPIAINALNEIFSFERKTLLEENNFLYDLKNSSQKDFFLQKFIFASSPDDFLCVETLEKLREYLGCDGAKGIYSLIEMNKIFKSDYVSIYGYLAFDENTKRVNYGIEINTIIDYHNKDLLQTKHLEACFLYNEAKVISYQKREGIYHEVYDLLELKSMPFASIPFIKDDGKRAKSSEFMKKKPFLMNKFIAQPVFSFENDIVYEINTKENFVKIIIYEYLPYYFSPKLHFIAGYLNFTKDSRVFLQEITKIENSQTLVLKFMIELPSNSHFSLKIPIKKLMKSFENYPHDAARGHPLIGSPIIYYLNNESNYWVEHTQNLLMRIPEPDFSMPFNISTYTFVLLGYFYLMVFKIAMGKLKNHWLIKKNNSLFQKINGFFKKTT